MTRLAPVLAACLLASLASPGAVWAQGRLADLERRYQRAADAHHDLSARVEFLRAAEAAAQRRMAPLTARIAELDGDGLLVRSERKALRREQNRIAAEVVTVRRQQRVNAERERIARLDLLLAGCDYARKLLRLANRDTARSTGEGRRTADRQGQRRREAARAVLVRLQRLEALADPAPIPLDALFGPETPIAELRNLQADCLELADEAQAEAARLSRAHRSRAGALVELRRSARLSPSLLALIPVEEIASDRLARLAGTMAERASRYEAEVARLETEITRRVLRSLHDELRRRG